MDPPGPGSSAATAPNPQYGNVGNRGDVLKHGALLALAEAVRATAGGVPVRYLDTHAFLLHAPHPSGLAWLAALRPRVAAHVGYADYAMTESPWSLRGRYRCSPGLVADRCPDAYLFLSERDAATRAELERQLQTEKREHVVVLPDAAAWATYEPEVAPGPFLALLDPFDQPDALGALLTAAAARLHAEDAPGAVLAFAYDREGEARWPVPPRGFADAGTVTERPYHVKAWCTEDLRTRARRDLAALGWATP